MTSYVEPFKFKNKKYSMHIVIDIPFANAHMHYDKCDSIISLSKSYDGYRAITNDFEVDFTALFDFIDENYEDILKYKKLYKKNKDSTKVANWFKNTPISDIERLKLNKFMDWFE